MCRPLRSGRALACGSHPACASVVGLGLALVAGVDVAAVFHLAAHAGARVHVQQHVVLGVTQQGGGAGDFKGLAGDDGAAHLAFQQHVVCFHGGGFHHTRGAECAPVLSSDNLQNSINAIFPNPTSDEVSVVLDKSFNDASLMTFMDSQGKIIVIQKLNNQANGIYKINVGEFSAGLYFVKVQNTENKLFTGKFIKISN